LLQIRVTWFEDSTFITTIEYFLKQSYFCKRSLCSLSQHFELFVLALGKNGQNLKKIYRWTVILVAYTLREGEQVGKKIEIY